MPKNRLKTGGHIVLLVLAVILLALVCFQNNQSHMALPLPLTFQGEYSLNGSDWAPLEGNSVPSALDGDLVLRGRFSMELPEDIPINFYLDHILYSIYTNGDLLSCSAALETEATPSMCARTWECIAFPAVGPEDTVEFRLYNPHRLGNADAYAELLRSLCVGSEKIVEHAQTSVNQPYRIAGLLIMTLSVGIIGVALAFSILRIQDSRQLWSLGLLCFFAGGCIALDAPDVSFWSKLNVFNTYALLLCTMLSMLELGLFLVSRLTTRVRKPAQIAVCAEMVFLLALVILCLTGRVLIYDTLPYWVWAQLVVCPVLLVCCIYDFVHKPHSVMLLSGALLLTAAILDCISILFAWWPNGIVFKCTFALLFAWHLIRGIKQIAVNYRKTALADTLADDLKSSRISLAQHQIKTHFIFNILNAISGMCKYDPEKADQTIVRFARYLRTNIDVLQDDQPAAFDVVLRIVEDYIALEQVRFGDKIQFATDIAVDDFMLPPMILQPIVENSIKHGLTPKPSGGTITLRTRLDGGNILIIIEDDGVGFDPAALDSTRSVGLNNVRFRLQQIMHGHLDIKSAPGCGTTVTIAIPCEEAEKCM